MKTKISIERRKNLDLRRKMFEVEVKVRIITDVFAIEWFLSLLK